MKAETPAIVKVRPLRSFDGSRDCVAHRHYEATHIGSVIVAGHRILEAGLCADCTVVWSVGTDTAGRPAGVRL